MTLAVTFIIQLLKLQNLEDMEHGFAILLYKIVSLNVGNKRRNNRNLINPCHSEEKTVCRWLTLEKARNYFQHKITPHHILFSSIYR
jgi:hypothetical protein